MEIAFVAALYIVGNVIKHCVSHYYDYKKLVWQEEQYICDAEEDNETIDKV